jgi:hypothetical protein
MNSREQDAQQSAHLLRQWLTVFEHRVQPGDLRYEGMVRYARSELDRIESRDAPSEDNDPRINDLIKRITWADEHLKGSERENYLLSLVELYQHKPWAKSVIEKARAAMK